MTATLNPETRVRLTREQFLPFLGLTLPKGATGSITANNFEEVIPGTVKVVLDEFPVPAELAGMTGGDGFLMDPTAVEPVDAPLAECETDEESATLTKDEIQEIYELGARDAIQHIALHLSEHWEQADETKDTVSEDCYEGYRLAMTFATETLAHVLG